MLHSKIPAKNPTVFKWALLKLDIHDARNILKSEYSRATIIALQLIKVTEEIIAVLSPINTMKLFALTKSTTPSYFFSYNFMFHVSLKFLSSREFLNLFCMNSKYLNV